MSPAFFRAAIYFFFFPRILARAKNIANLAGSAAIQNSDGLSNAAKALKIGRSFR
jgi:hypothetical protein